MIRNILAIILISLSLSIFGYLFLNTEKKPINPFQAMIQKDLQSTILQTPDLKPLLDNVVEIKYVYHSKISQKLLGQLPIVNKLSKGNIKLEIEFIDEPTDVNFIILQFNFIDLKSSNKIYELNRRYNIKNLIKN